MALKQRAYRQNSKLAISGFKVIDIVQPDPENVKDIVTNLGRLIFQVDIYINTRETRFSNREYVGDEIRRSFFLDELIVREGKDNTAMGVLWAPWSMDKEKAQAPSISTATQIQKSKQGVVARFTVAMIPWLSMEKVAISNKAKAKQLVSNVIEVIDFQLSLILQNPEHRNLEQYRAFIEHYVNPDAPLHFNYKILKQGERERSETLTKEAIQRSNLPLYDTHMVPLAGGAVLVGGYTTNASDRPKREPAPSNDPYPSKANEVVQEFNHNLPWGNAISRSDPKYNNYLQIALFNPSDNQPRMDDIEYLTPWIENPEDVIRLCVNLFFPHWIKMHKALLPKENQPYLVNSYVWFMAQEFNMYLGAQSPKWFASQKEELWNYLNKNYKDQINQSA
jgi:hypothetical protein